MILPLLVIEMTVISVFETSMIVPSLVLDLKNLYLDVLDLIVIIVPVMS